MANEQEDAHRKALLEKYPPNPQGHVYPLQRLPIIETLKQVRKEQK